MKKYLFALGLIMVLYHTMYAQNETPGFIKDSLDNYISKAIQKWKIPGIAVAIVKDGKVVISKGYGQQSKDRTDKVDENTLFLIGSNTKAFTGTIMAMLQDEKKCSLNDKVIKWLPDFTMKDPWIKKELNLTDILCHRIGMETFQGDFMYWTSNLTREEVIKKFGQLTPVYGFRSKWGYTNAGFLVAGECIKKISGQSWEDNIRERIFKPLQMEHSRALSVEMPSQQNIAAPHTLYFDTLKLLPYPIIDNLAPAGSISSSVSDMSHWMICQLDNGKYNGNQVIPESAIQETRKAASIIGNSHLPFNRNHFALYGLGWQLSDYDGRKVVSHTGGVNGFVSSVSLLPEEKLGVVILTNTDQNYLFEALKMEIIDAYLNLPYRNYSDLYYNFFNTNAKNEFYQYKAQKDTVSMTNKEKYDLKTYEGKYIHPIYGFLEIKTSGNKLSMTFEHHPQLTGTIEYLNNNRFLCTYNDPTFGFKVIGFKSEKNKIKSLVLRVADFVEFTEYEFIKK